MGGPPCHGVLYTTLLTTKLLILYCNVTILTLLDTACGGRGPIGAGCLYAFQTLGQEFQGVVSRNTGLLDGSSFAFERGAACVYTKGKEGAAGSGHRGASQHRAKRKDTEKVQKEILSVRESNPGFVRRPAD